MKLVGFQFQFQLFGIKKKSIGNFTFLLYKLYNLQYETNRQTNKKIEPGRNYLFY